MLKDVGREAALSEHLFENLSHCGKHLIEQAANIAFQFCLRRFQPFTSLQMEKVDQIQGIYVVRVHRGLYQPVQTLLGRKTRNIVDIFDFKRQVRRMRRAREAKGSFLSLK